MADLDTLHEAFTELERRADALPAERRSTARTTGPARGTRMLLVAATVVAVGGIATGAAVLSGSDDGREAGAPSPTASSSIPTPVPSSSVPTPSESTPTPTSTASGRSSVTSVSAPRPSTVTPVGAGGLPATAAQLAARLRTVLGRTATFTYSAPAGSDEAVIQGVLTNTVTHRKGGFDLQTVDAKAGDPLVCEDADTSHCVITHLPSGAVVSVGHEPIQGGTLYLVNLVRKHGGGLLMHVSSTGDPKGGGGTLSSKPPLTRNQIVAILDSSRW